MPRTHVLIVEDDEVLGDALAQWLRQDGHRVTLSRTGAAALLHDEVDVVLLDYRLPDIDGFEVLRRLQSTRVPVVMLTGHASVGHAVEAMKRGAFHYLPKPVELPEVSRAVQHAAVVGLARRDRGEPEEVGDDPTRYLLGEAPSIERVREMIRRLASNSDVTVLITGESGTGKDLAARALHTASARAERCFTNVMCTALPSALLESELFGHERGAFTDAKTRHVGLVERSEGGTVFLDEIGDLDIALQGKLLNVIEHKTFRRVGGTEDLCADVRVVAATNVDLREAIEAGRFRSDLYYRLAVMVLHMPPLRDRRSDIGLLARHFAEHFGRNADGVSSHLTDAALRKLAAHDWPGNVRELRNVIERAMILASGPTVDEDDIELPGGSPSAAATFELPAEGVDLRVMERELVAQALERTGGNVTRAAKLLGMNRDQVRYRVHKFGLRAAGE